MKVSHRASQEVHDLYDRIDNLEAENRRLKGVLEDGCDLGLAPDECKEALAKCPAPPQP